MVTLTGIEITGLSGSVEFMFKFVEYEPFDKPELVNVTLTIVLSLLDTVPLFGCAVNVF